MAENKLITEYRQEFKKIKEDLGFKATYDQIESIFFIEDMIKERRFISSCLSRMICRRIVDTYSSWYNYLHSLVMPPPHVMANVMESQIFSEEEKKEFMDIMKKIMALISKNSIVGLSKDKSEESQFIDESIEFWNNSFKEKMISVLSKVKQMWSD